MNAETTYADVAVQLVGRYHDVLHRDGSRWRFHHRAAVFDTA
jgi:hypothetical protein